MEQIKVLIEKMTLEEKAALCSGQTAWLTKGNDRLGIPSIWLTDGPHGLRKQIGKTDNMGVEQSESSVSFPAECATASSFDRKLLWEIGQTLGEQCQAEQVQVLLGPGVNIKRSPLCGRNFEYFSEDPLLAGEMGAAYVNGIQSKGVGACVKHFCVNNQETRRMTVSSELDERTLREIYLSAFERIVKKANPWSMMASYNKINGKYATENRGIMVDILRKEWGYDGCLVSDWGAVHSRPGAVAGGTDLTMPGDAANDGNIVRAVQAGMLPEALVDIACEHILKFVFTAHEARLSKEQAGSLDFVKGHAIAKKAEEASAVLMKNDGILPLNKSQKIAFIGDLAMKPRFQGGGSSTVNAPNVVGAMEAIKNTAEVIYARGYDGVNSNDTLIGEAVEAAKIAEICVVFLGLPPALESEGIDRVNMTLPESNNALLDAVLAVNPNVVVVLQTGSPVELPWAEQVRAILQMYYGGEAVGEATVNLLFGNVNPSGHLAETWPIKLSDNPSFLFFPGNGNAAEYREGIYVGYRYYETKQMDVRYPFGHGLSYTSFAYSNLHLSSNIMKTGDILKVAVDVTNTGSIAGKAVPQLYVAVKDCVIMRPVKELRGFEKVELAPGETKTVTFTLENRDFSYWDVDSGCFRMPGGSYEIQIGENAHDVSVSKGIIAEDETILGKIEYTMLTLVGDLLKHPVGNAFFEMNLDALAEGIIKSGISGHVTGGNNLTKEQIRGMTKGLHMQPLSTLKMFLPEVTEAEWNALLEKLNA